MKFIPMSGRSLRSSALLLVLMGLLVLPSPAQSQGSSQSNPPKPQAQAPAEAGGPEGDVGPIILPKKKDDDAPPPPPASATPKQPEGMPDFSIRVDVPVVNVPVTVVTKDGQFIPGLKRENFKIFEDGQPQQISNFGVSQAPITAVLLVEFASTAYRFMYDALNASYTFAATLKPQDWIAVVSYDMRSHIITDFTQDKREVYAALGQLRIPGFSETNLFDALYDTLDRLDRIEGRKYVILIASGRDTFSKLTYDKMLKKVRETPNVQIYTISTGEAFRMWLDSVGGSYFGVQQYLLDLMQADNEMNSFAKLTGGRWYKPRFEGELPEIFRDIASNIRNEYTIAYHPTNAKLDGTYRKLKVELTAPDGGPLKVKDQKGHDLKFMIIAREGYTAKHQVE